MCIDDIHVSRDAVWVIIVDAYYVSSTFLRTSRFLSLGSSIYYTFISWALYCCIQCKVQIVRPYISVSICSQYVLGSCRCHTLCLVIAFEDIYTVQNDQFERL
jgi:uncharacterized membrane protein